MKHFKGNYKSTKYHLLNIIRSLRQYRNVFYNINSENKIIDDQKT
jgi:hypothetical protein